MKTKPVVLARTQIFNLKRRGLEARVKNHYETYKHSAYIVECAVAVMVRNALSSADYSAIARDTLRDVFLVDEPNKLVAVRHLCVYFREYFSPEEWQKVLNRHFKNQQEYLQITESTRQNDHLHKLLHSGSREQGEAMNVATVFKDAHGKKHRFTLKDTDPCHSIEETTALLSILTSLTIFEKDGVRRFTELVRYLYLPTEPVYDCEQEAKRSPKEEAPAEAETETDLVALLQPLIIKARTLLANTNVVDENEVTGTSELISATQYLENNVYADKTMDELTSCMLEDFVLPENPDENELLSRILTAFIRGTKLKDAKPEVDLSDVPQDPPGTAPDKSNPNKSKKNQSKKRSRKKKQSKTFETPETIRQRREAYKEELRIRKATGDKKKGRKKKKKR